MSKSKESEASGKVFNYMKTQNRPYSVGDILLNMHKEFNKPCIQRCLDELVSEGKMKEKVYGKQKIYSIDQSMFPTVDEKELLKMDRQITELQSLITTVQSECQTKESMIKSLENSLTLTDAKAHLISITEECGNLAKRLSVIKEGINKITPAQSEQIRKKNKTTVDQWRKRKRMTLDVVNSILEGYPKSKKELLEEIGMETDEECGIVLPANI